MFLKIPFEFNGSVQQAALIVNTVLLIAALIVVELVYSETPKDQRQHLKHFLPIILVLGGLLLFAVFKQIGKS